jgi:hypothetical protein
MSSSAGDWISRPRPERTRSGRQPEDFFAELYDVECEVADAVQAAILEYGVRNRMLDIRYAGRQGRSRTLASICATGHVAVGVG